MKCVACCCAQPRCKLLTSKPYPCAFCSANAAINCCTIVGLAVGDCVVDAVTAFVVVVGVADVANANMSNIYMRLLIYGRFSVAGPSIFTSCKMQLHQTELVEGTKKNIGGKKSQALSYKFLCCTLQCATKISIKKQNGEY